MQMMMNTEWDVDNLHNWKKKCGIEIASENSVVKRVAENAIFYMLSWCTIFKGVVACSGVWANNTTLKVKKKYRERLMTKF